MPTHVSTSVVESLVRIEVDWVNDADGVSSVLLPDLDMFLERIEHSVCKEGTTTHSVVLSDELGADALLGLCSSVDDDAVSTIYIQESMGTYCIGGVVLHGDHELRIVGTADDSGTLIIYGRKP